MAQGDSVGRDLDKRTRDLERQKIQPGQGLAAQQIAQNQLQAIQNEQRNNLSQQRLQEQANAQAQQIAVQAAQVGTMETGPAVETLKRYGLTKPRTVRTQSRDIKVAPPNITINTTNNTTTTTGGGPTAGRDIMFRQPQQNASTNKFKAWLSGLLLSQKEENAKREREFDRRDSALVRSSNKMLKRIEAAGRDIATNLNPKVIGTTVGNQFRMLLMIFALGFLAKHWDKVMNVLDKIVGFFKSSLDYFGITNRQEGRPSPFYQDLLTFFGAKTGEDSLFQVFGRLGKELIDYLKMKLEHAMSLRGDAIKNIKFPEIDTGDIFKTLSSIAGYVGNILTAMMDPKKGVQDSIQREVNASMSAIARDSEKEQHKFSDEVKGVRGLKDTSYGDYAAEVRHALTHNALNESGDLRNNTWASLSQGRDLVQAYQNSQNGVIDIARMGGGLQRLQDTATKEGFVTLDSETINSLFGNQLQSLIQSGDIKPVAMKYVQVKKTDQDYADENADPGSAFIKGGLTGAALDMVPGSGVIAGVAGGAKGTVEGGVIGPWAQIKGAYGAITGYLKTTKAGGAIIGGGEAYMKKHFYSDDNTLRLVPADDPRPGIALGGRIVRNYYQVNPNALNRLASIITNNTEITKIDSGSERFMKALEQNLVSRAGGEGRVRSRDYNITQGYEAIRKIEERERFYEQEEENSAFSQSLRTIGNNGKRLVNRAYQGLGTAISTVGNYISSFSKGGSNEIRNWLYGGQAPGTAFKGSADEARMARQMVRVSVPIRDLNGRETTHTLTVHKYLAEDVKSIFNEIYETTTFRIDPATTGAFNYRNIHHEVNSGNISPHAFGYAIDINWNINTCPDHRTVNTDVHLGTAAHPVVQIFYSHRWQWGGAWKKKDNMHFEYAGKPNQVGRSTEGARMSYMDQAGSDGANAGYTSSGFSIQGAANFGGGGSISYQAQGTYVGYQAPIVAPTEQTEYLNWEDSAGKGKGAQNNNPGNRRGNDTLFGSGERNGFTYYDSLENGFAGNANLIIGYLNGTKGPRKRNPTVREIINAWCPPGADGNSVEAVNQYIENVGKWSGLGTDTPIPVSYRSVLALNASIGRHDSGIRSKKDLLAGTSKAWSLYTKGGGLVDNLPLPDNGDNQNLAAFGEGMMEVGQSMQNTQLFPVESQAEIDRKNRRSANILKLQDSFSVTDDGIRVKDGYYKDYYGANATFDSILDEWDRDPNKMNRDVKYAPIFAKADEIWGKFHSGDEEIRSELLGGATSKEDFRKRYSSLSVNDRNRLIKIVNKWIKGRYKKLDDYKDVKYGEKNIMDVLQGADDEKKDLYTQLMSTGQYAKAHNLMVQHINDRYDSRIANAGNEYYRQNLQRAKEAELKRSEEQFKEGKAYDIHGEEYRELQRELNAARLDLEEAKKKQKDANKGYWEWGHITVSKEKIDQERVDANAAVTEAQQRVESLQEQSNAYTKVDESINTTADAATVAPVITEFDKKTKRSLEIRERLAQIEKERRGEGETRFTNTADFLAAEKEWDKEKEQLLKELNQSEQSLKQLIGEDQKELLITHKNKVKEMYERMGKDVTNAEKEYMELAKTGKSHQEIMLEIGNKFDEETVGYLQNFGEALVEEKKKAEEAARQQLRMLAAQIANIDVGSVDWDNEYFQGDLNSGQLGKRAKIMSLAKKGLPITGINEDEVPPGYSWNQQYHAYLPTDQSKWAIQKTIRTYRDQTTGKLMKQVYKDDYYTQKMATAAASSATQIAATTNNLLSQQNVTLESINLQMGVLNRSVGTTNNYMYNLNNGFSTGSYFPIYPTTPTHTQVPFRVQQ